MNKIFGKVFSADNSGNKIIVIISIIFIVFGLIGGIKCHSESVHYKKLAHSVDWSEDAQNKRYYESKMALDKALLGGVALSDMYEYNSAADSYNRKYQTYSSYMDKYNSYLTASQIFFALSITGVVTCVALIALNNKERIKNLFQIE